MLLLEEDRAGVPSALGAGEGAADDPPSSSVHLVLLELAWMGLGVPSPDAELTLSLIVVVNDLTVPSAARSSVSLAAIFLSEEFVGDEPDGRSMSSLLLTLCRGPAEDEAAGTEADKTGTLSVGRADDLICTFSRGFLTFGGSDIVGSLFSFRTSLPFPLSFDATATALLLDPTFSLTTFFLTGASESLDGRAFFVTGLTDSGS